MDGTSWNVELAALPRRRRRSQSFTRWIGIIYTEDKEMKSIVHQNLYTKLEIILLFKDSDVRNVSLTNKISSLCEKVFDFQVAKNRWRSPKLTFPHDLRCKFIYSAAAKTAPRLVLVKWWHLWSNGDDIVSLCDLTPSVDRDLPHQF